ncbi:L-galactose dehydrogenase-like Protein [Elysia marginata]|uniref:L-galactose dehydrogenase-like Protein n=1 Tax=Elysia marginata TaxID=1093978 RepID=A0AAV4JD72_9GAST|nr:L-galactose dehydrogenase-like Protein [Elysia marginata]
MGLLSTRGPPVWHPATQHIKDVCAQAAAYCQPGTLLTPECGKEMCVNSPSQRLNADLPKQGSNPGLHGLKTECLPLDHDAIQNMVIVLH